MILPSCSQARMKSVRRNCTLYVEAKAQSHKGLFQWFVFRWTLAYVGVATTISFSNSPFPPRDHFLYYSVCCIAGRAMGYFSFFIASLLIHRPSSSVQFQVKRLWIFSLAQVSLSVFLLLASLYRFIPTVYLLFGVILILGYVFGFTYVNLLNNLSKTENSDFAITLVGPICAVGIVIGSLLAGVVEPALRYHCIEYYKTHRGSAELCLTRAVSKKMICK